MLRIFDRAFPIVFDEVYASETQQRINDKQIRRSQQARHQRKQSTKNNSEMDEQRKQAALIATEMFARKNDHGVIEHPHIVQATFFGAFSFIVNDGGVGQVIVCVAGLHNALAEVQIFAIHKKGFIEQAYFI